MSERTQTTSPEFAEWFDATYPEDSYSSMWRDCVRDISVRAWDAARNAAPRKGQEHAKCLSIVGDIDYAVVNATQEYCSCGGNPADDPKACDACRIYHWIMDAYDPERDGGWQGRIESATHPAQPHHCDRYVNPSCQTCWPDGGMHEQPDDDSEGEGHGP